jgi:hypothetical protein
MPEDLCLGCMKLTYKRSQRWTINPDNTRGVAMGRPERPLDPDGGPVVVLAIALRELRGIAGSPSYRMMAKQVYRSPTALSEAAGGAQLPTWDTVEAYVRACGGDPALLRDRWNEAAATHGDTHAGAAESALAPGEVEVEGEDIAVCPRRKLRRAWIVAGALGVIAIGVVAVMVFNRPSSAPAAAVAPLLVGGTESRVADGADPKDSGCALDPGVVTLDSAEVDFQGQPAGLDELRYSPRCGVAWTRFEPFPKARIPAGAVIHVDVVRPDDHNVRFPFQAKYVGAPIYGNVALSTARCVYAASWIEVAKKPVPESRTHCFRGKTPERATESNG